MSKSLALVIQGLILLGDGLKGIAGELEEGAGNTFLGTVAQTKPEEKSAETEKGSIKKGGVLPKKEEPQEATPGLDEAALREECTALVKKLALAQKKPEILECFKKFGIAKVTECPVDKLEQLTINLGRIKI